MYIYAYILYIPVLSLIYPLYILHIWTEVKFSIQKIHFLNSFKLFIHDKVRFLRTFCPRRAVWPELQSFYTEKVHLLSSFLFFIPKKCVFWEPFAAGGLLTRTPGLKMTKWCHFWRVWPAGGLLTRTPGLKITKWQHFDKTKYKKTSNCEEICPPWEMPGSDFVRTELYLSGSIWTS